MERALTAMPSFEELTADPLGAPVRVLGRHDGDQLTDLGFHARSAQRTAGAPAPEQAPALAMPAEHGLGPDQEEVASPVPVEATDQEPEELVASVEAGPMPAAECDLELLAEEQVLEEEALPAAEGASEGWPGGAGRVRTSEAGSPIVTTPARAGADFCRTTPSAPRPSALLTRSLAITQRTPLRSGPRRPYPLRRPRGMRARGLVRSRKALPESSESGSSGSLLFGGRRQAEGWPRLSLGAHLLVHVI